MPRRQSVSKKASAADKPTSKSPQKKRAYNSPLREQQIAATKERIINAGAELIHGYESWDWNKLNALAVAKRAGVGKRTVQRYFPSEKILRDAVLQHLLLESGVQFEQLTLDDFGSTVEKIFRYLQSFALTSVYPYDPTVKTLDQQGRSMLLKAVTDAKPDWPESKQIAAAALLDMFWQPLLLDRMTTTWGMEMDHAVGIIKWLIEMIDTAIKKDRLPDLWPQGKR